MSEEIVKHDRQGLEVLGGTEQMSERLSINSERLELVHQFISDNFRKGTDYGEADPRNDKLTLLKPGAERLSKLFGTRPVWRMDSDTWRMLGEPAGVVCYVCEFIDNTTGEVIGEGRGAEKVGNKQRDANKAIKAAQKCAMVDAALTTFGLSELFTQDRPPSKNDLDGAKVELRSFVEDIRAGVDSTMTNNMFIVAVVKDHTHSSTLQSVGAVKAVRDAIKSGAYDLATGDRVPE